MSSKATKAAIDLATLDAIERADHFTASIRVRNSQTTYPLKSLAQAREAARLMPAALGALGRALVYAVTPEGRAYLVPEDFPDPSNPNEREAIMNLARMAETLGNQTHRASNGVALAGPKPTPAPEAGKAAKGDPLDSIPPEFRRPPMTEAQKAELKAKTKAELNKVPATRSPASPASPTAAKPGSAHKPPSASAKSAQSTSQPAKAKASDKPKADDDKENESMRKTSKTTANKARTPVKAAAKTKPTKPAGERTRYDWSAADDKAAKGTIPPAPDFSAATHERFRPLLAEVVKAAKARDPEALRKIKINPVSSSPKAVDRYRKLCLKALSAQKAA